jgi:hypothetical protein
VDEPINLTQYKREVFEKLKNIGHVDIIEQIKSKKIHFRSLSYPACNLPNYKVFEHTIFIDVNYFKVSINYNTDEICVVILHELGHILNKPEEINELDENTEEFFADKFVIDLGFQNELLSGIKKLRDWKSRNHLDTYVIDKRIKRIEKENPLFQGV